MTISNMGLGIVFTASDLASSVIKGLTKSFLGLDDVATRTADNMAKKLGVSTEVVTKSMS